MLFSHHVTHGHAPNRPRRRTEAPSLPGQASKKDHDTRAALFMRHKYALLYWIPLFLPFYSYPT